MLKNNDNKQSQMPDHFLCGEVYTWLCAGELYAVECKLCEDRPLCPLSEFPQHMEVWHTPWETITKTITTQNHDHDDDNQHNDAYSYDFLAKENNMFVVEMDNYLQNDEITNGKETQVKNNEEILQPFEQVLIEQDLTIDATCNSEVVNEEAFFTDANEQVAESEPYQIKKQPQHKQKHSFNVTLKYRKYQRGRDTIKQNINNERKIQLITKLKQGKIKLDVNKLRNKLKRLKLQIKCKNNEKFFKKFYNFERNAISTTGIANTTALTVTTNSSGKQFIESSKIRKIIKKNLIKIPANKKYFRKIVKNMGVCPKINNNTNETSKSEKNEIKMKANETKVSENEINKAETIKNKISGSEIEPRKNKINTTEIIEKETEPSRYETEIGKNKINKIKTIENETSRNVKENEISENKINNTETIENETENETSGNETEYETSGNETELRKNKINTTERIEKETETETNGYETEHETSKNKINIDNETENETNGNEKTETIEKETEKIENETVTKTSADETETVKNGTEIETIENETLIIENVTANETSGKETEVSKNKINKTKTIENGTAISGNETERNQNSIHYTETGGIETNLCQSETRDTETYRNKTITNENETETNKNETKTNENIIYETDTGETETDTCKSETINTETDLNEAEIFQKEKSTFKINKNETNENETNEIKYSKCLLTTKAKNYSNEKEKPTRNLKEKDLAHSSLNETGTNENEMNQKNDKFVTKLESFKNFRKRSTKKPSCYKTSRRKFKENCKSSKKQPQREMKLCGNETKHVVSSKPVKENLVGNISLEYKQENSRDETLSHKIDQIKAEKKSVSSIRQGLRSSKRANQNEASKKDIVDLEMQRAARLPTRYSYKKVTEKDHFICYSKEAPCENEVFQGSNNHRKMLDCKRKKKDFKIVSNKQTLESFVENSANGDMESAHDIVSCAHNNVTNTASFMDKGIEKLEISKENIEQQNQELDNSLSLNALPASPISPKTEEEHFEFYEPKEKLNKEHISHLIKLYREHPRLWDQAHSDFCEPQICRKSWQQITDQWNEFCRRKFSIAEVRIRICTLCQRFIQEKERLAAEGELDEYAKFPYYEQMQFLEKQKSLQKRRQLYDTQNKKILEIYQQFPLLWHINCYKLKQAKERAQAFESISQTLKLYDLHLSAVGVQKRICSLRKYYRLEKIRHLHAQVEQTTFQPEFQHYERMQFLDKHIDPFVCHICGKIFKNLQSFRAHLVAENHGCVLPEEAEDDKSAKQTTVDAKANSCLDLKEKIQSCLLSSQETELNRTQSELFIFSPISNHNYIECFSESENSTDILKGFNTFCSTPKSSLDSMSHLQLLNSANSALYNDECLNVPKATAADNLIEKIMAKVTANESLSQTGLDQFINSSANFDNNNCLTQSTLSSHICNAQNVFDGPHPDVITKHSLDVLVPLTNGEIFEGGIFYLEKSLIVDQPIIETDPNLCVLSSQPNLAPAETITDSNFYALRAHRNFSQADTITDPQPNILTNPNLCFLSSQPTFVSHILPNNISLVFEKSNLTRDLIVENEENIAEEPQVEESETVVPISEPSTLLLPQCLDFCAKDSSLNNSDHELLSAADTTTLSLPDHLIHKMIELYRKYPQLWNPNHLDYNSRNLRRQAWCSLTADFNNATNKNVSWRTVNRKLSDYAKYYKKLITDQKVSMPMENKWIFYEDFKFIDDVIAVNDELQRNVHHRDNNFKIIAIYKTLPQLWNIKHPDFNKRCTKQRNMELMCNRLQEENNLQLTTERLKIRLIELRTQYRAAKKQRLKCIKNQQKFSYENFEFYEALNFLEDHIDPFICDKCKIEFKKLTDYNQHLKREHSQKTRLKNSSSIAVYDAENICHICGIEFTSRSNLVHHIKRHEGIRNYECNMCPKKFYASHALKVHIRSHTKECPYTCEKCGMSFVSASKLNQHVKRHTNKKDFLCDFCPKEFFTAYEKARHERRHLNIRDKTCSICGKTFVAGSSYYAHLMLHSGTKRFECNICATKFAQYAGLYKHKKRHHST